MASSRRLGRRHDGDPVYRATTTTPAVYTMRRSHFFWRTLISLLGAFAIAWAWRVMLSAVGQPPAPAGQAATQAVGPQSLGPLTMWVPAALIAGWAGFWLGGWAWLVWWLLSLRLAWGIAANVLLSVGSSDKPLSQMDIAGAWLLALMPVVGGLIGAALGRRAFWAGRGHGDPGLPGQPPPQQFPPEDGPPDAGADTPSGRRETFRKRDVYR
jgi:hypothetical protein